MFRNYRVTENIYHIEDPLGVFVTLIVGKTGALLFDTSYGIFDLKNYIAGITCLPLTVVNSHGHLDHVCGNYQFDEIYIHREDIPLAAEHNSARMRQTAIDQAKSKGLLPDNYDVEAYLKQPMGNVKPVGEGHCFELGGCSLEVIDVPGHTRGSIGLLERRSSILLVGDAANPFIWLFGPESTQVREYIETLNKIDKLQFDSFLVSHNHLLFPKSKIGQFIHCASNIDIEKSRTIKIPFIPDKELLVYSEGGQDFRDPDFCAVVYLPEKLG